MLALLLLMCMDGLSARQVAKQVDELIDQPGLRDGFWGVRIWAPERDRVIFERNPESNFRPASNLKLVTALTAFEVLGGDYVFVTDLAYLGDITADGALEGDLVIVASGDPSLSSNYEWGWDGDQIADLFMDAIGDMGIREVRGDLRICEPLFDDEFVDGTWEVGDLGTYYGASVTGFALNDGWIIVELERDVGGGVAVDFEPSWLSAPIVLDLDLGGKIDEEPELAVERLNDGGFRVSGRMPPCSEARLRLAVERPDRQAGIALRRLLASRGIPLAGSVTIENVVPDHLRPIGSWHSLALRDLTKTLLKQSQNRYADCFAKATAAAWTGEGSFDRFAETADAVSQLYASQGFNGITLRDGSGLSGQDYLRPRFLTDLLTFAISQPYSLDWLRALPVMGLDGTLEKRGGDLTRGRVWAKTGYINRSRSLSGYVETAFGEPLVFSIMVNNYGVDTAEVNRVQDEICALMVCLKPPFWRGSRVQTRKFSQAFHEPLQ